MLFPITFSIPYEKIVKGIPVKTKIISNLIPGKLETYIYNTEEEYYNEYKTSYFATTCKKAGWDCMRHYEILANGCIPYFIDIEKCPENTMALLPKQLLLNGNKLYHQFIQKKIDELTYQEIHEYNILLTKLLDHLKNHLTTHKIAKYILNKTGFENVSKVLYLSENLLSDYLRDLTLHGFKELFGLECHDYPKLNYLYKSNNLNFNESYGKGFTYTNLLDPSVRNDSIDDKIEENIRNKYYDIIIYGSYHRGMPNYHFIREFYSSDKIILLCGEDEHCCGYHDFLKEGHTLFIREL